MNRTRRSSTPIALALLCLAAPAVAAERAPFQLNEVMPRSGDRLGRRVFDWAELVNRGVEPADVRGWTLEGHAGPVFSFPSAMPAVPAGAHVVVRFDGRGEAANDYDVASGATLHAELDALDALGEVDQLALRDAAGALRDFVAWGERPGSAALEAVDAGLWLRGGFAGPRSPAPGARALVETGASVGVAPWAGGDIRPDRWVVYRSDETTPGAANGVPAPILYSPPDGAATSERRPAIGWSGVAGATRYRLDLALDEDFTATVAELELDRLVWAPQVDLPLGELFMRVQALRDDEMLGAPSRTRRIEIVPAEGEGGGAASATLGVRPFLQHKDNRMVCLGAHNETGRYRWDSASEVDGDLVVGNGAPERGDTHGDELCTRACLSMLADYFGSSLSQDRISFEHFRGSSPELDLGHGQGAWPCESVTQRTGGCTMRWVFNDVLPLSGIGRPTAAQAKGWIDAGRPLLAVEANGDGTTHATVIDGYRLDGAMLRRVDPWTATAGWISLSSWALVEFHVTPVSPTVRADEPGLSSDADGDGLIDFDETVRFGTDFLSADSDGDGVRDLQDIREYVFDGAGSSFLRPADFDGDGLRKERDQDNDADGEVDGCEDFNGNGVFEPGLGETSNFNGASGHTDTPEPNDTPATAVALATVGSSWVRPGDVDYYFFNATEVSDAGLTVRLKDTSPQSALRVALDGYPAKRIADTLQISRRVTPGRHLVEVRGASPSSRNCYALELALMPPSIPGWLFTLPDPPLFNYLVPELEQVVRVFPAEPGADADYFVVRHDALGALDVSLRTAEGAPLELTLLDAAGEVVARMSAGSGADNSAPGGPPGTRASEGRLAVPELPAGEYVIVVSGGAPGTEYTLGAGAANIVVDFSAELLRDAAPLALAPNVTLEAAVGPAALLAQRDVFVNASSLLPFAGIRGWSLGVALEGDAEIADVFIDGMAADRAGGFVSALAIDPARNGGLRGLVMGAALSLDELVTLPPAGRESLVGFTVETSFPAELDERVLTLSLRDGLVAAGDPVVNVFTVRSESVPPANLETAAATLRFTRERRPQDIVLERIVVDRDPVQVGDPIAVRAAVWNDGASDVTNVPIVFEADGESIHSTTIAWLPAGAVEIVETSWNPSEIGSHLLAAIVDPDGALRDDAPSNNSAALEVDAVFETSPGWNKFDLALSDLSITPSRAAASSTVEVTAVVSNRRRRPLYGETYVTLLVDGEAVDLAAVVDLESSSREVTLRWDGATPGRHGIVLEVEHEYAIEEKDLFNNRIAGVVRVAGAALERPDVEVATLPVPIPRPEQSVPLRFEISNFGFADAAALDWAVLVDGLEVGRGTLEGLLAGEARELLVDAGPLSPGSHVVTVRIDPDARLDDDSIQSVWADELWIPGPQPSLAVVDSPRRWTSIGPRPIRHVTPVSGDYCNGQTPSGQKLTVDVGRMDSIDISRQDPLVLVAGSPRGGAWRSEDGGATWQPLTDALPAPEFKLVRLDPRDDRVIYAANSSGLYTSRDAGITWALAVDSADGRADHVEIIVRYEEPQRPDRATIYAGTGSGIWRYRIDRDADVAASIDHLWWRAGAAANGSDERSQVQSVLVTAETQPRLAFSVRGLGVIAVDLANPPATWPIYNTGFDSRRGTVTLGNSPAKPERLFAAMTLDAPCSGESPPEVWLYSRDAADAMWKRLGALVKSGLCNRAYNEYIAVHPTDASRLFHGGVGHWRYNAAAGGQGTWTPLANIHADAKDVRFSPHDPNVMYFTSDGGIYRCDGNGEGCVSLNADLVTTQFFDIALSASNPDLIIGGTQDNGTLRYDAPSLEWRRIRGGDGKFCAIDPRDERRMYTQEQYIQSTRLDTDGGLVQGTYPACWRGPKRAGLPSDRDTDTRDPFLVMDPSDPQTLLVTGKLVHRTTDGGDNWASIGPVGKQPIARLAIDDRIGRYYAATDDGELLVARETVPSDWRLVADHPDPNGRGVGTIALDPVSPARVYATYSGSTGLRIARYTHSGGWPGTWSAAEDLGAGLPGSRQLTGGGFVVGVRGLVKDPGSETIWVGTDRGVYEGRFDGADWRWALDTCGLPRTWVTDLELHPSGAFLVAATFGRGAFRRPLVTSSVPPDIYDAVTRNDEPADFTDLGTVNVKLPGASLAVEGLTMDRLDDRDWFKLTLEDPRERGLPACFAPGDPEFGDRRATQGFLEIEAIAKDNPDPFELVVYDISTGVLEAVGELATRSYLNVTIECPLSTFARRDVVISVRSLSGCLGTYDLRVFYTHATWRHDTPELEFDPPMFRPLPFLDRLDWLFPADPAVINRAFEVPGTALPPQEVVFPWDEAGVFDGTLSVLGRGAIEATLSTLDGRELASTAASGAGAGDGAAAGAAPLRVELLPEGWYRLAFHDGALGTAFRLDVEPPDVEEGLGPFTRADANRDGTANISDASAILGYLFLGAARPACFVAADANADGAVNIADPNWLLNYLFLGGPPPPAPHPSCGRSERASDLTLGCEAPLAACD